MAWCTSRSSAPLAEVGKTTDIVKEGDKVWVKLLGFAAYPRQGSPWHEDGRSVEVKGRTESEAAGEPPDQLVRTPAETPLSLSCSEIDL